jgi:hypothetical protein
MLSSCSIFEMPLHGLHLSLKKHLSYKMLSLLKLLSRIFFIHLELLYNWAEIQISTSEGSQADRPLRMGGGHEPESGPWLLPV